MRAVVFDSEPTGSRFVFLLRSSDGSVQIKDIKQGESKIYGMVIVQTSCSKPGMVVVVRNGGLRSSIWDRS